MITLIKLGGSLITDKRVENTFRREVAARIADELFAAWQPGAQWVIGHGSGSFGHVAAKKYGTMDGVQTPEQWRGFAEVGAVAAQLNGLVTDALRVVGLPILRVQPSASAVSRGGKLIHLSLDPLRRAVENGVIPLVYGDVSLDEERGGTIVSTETLFTYLVGHLPVGRVLLVGEVPGVYDEAKTVIPEITPTNVEQYRGAFGGSRGTDVTGGMLTKVEDMLALVTEQPELTVQIIDGTQPGVLRATLKRERQHGTLIHAGSPNR